MYFKIKGSIHQIQVITVGGRLNVFWIKFMARKKKEKFVICVKNNECDDLYLFKIYRVLNDKKAQKNGFIRVVDESGEDYLYPAFCFIPISISHKVEAVLNAA